MPKKPGTQTLTCKNCWIEVMTIPKAASTVGKGKDYQYKHTKLRDDRGQPFCGRVLLNAEDVEFTTSVTELDD